MLALPSLNLSASLGIFFGKRRHNSMKGMFERTLVVREGDITDIREVYTQRTIQDISQLITHEIKKERKIIGKVIYVLTFAI